MRSHSRLFALFGILALVTLASGAVVVTRAAAPTKEAATQSQVSVSINNGEFKADMTEGDIAIRIVGTVEGKKVKVSEIVIVEPGAKASYTDVDKVPEKYRAKVKKLIANGDDSPLKFEFKVAPGGEGAGAAGKFNRVIGLTDALESPKVIEVNNEQPAPKP